MRTDCFFDRDRLREESPPPFADFLYTMSRWQANLLARVSALLSLLLMATFLGPWLAGMLVSLIWTLLRLSKRSRTLGAGE